MSLGVSEKSQEDAWKMHYCRLGLDGRKRFFSQRGLGHWNCLPREGLPAPRLRELQKSLDTALGHRLGFLRLS